MDKIKKVMKQALPIALVATLISGTTWAHVEAGAASGFLSGLIHPLTGLDHIVAMIAVGLWGALLGRPAIWILPVAFPVMMALGGLLGLIGMPLPGVEVGISASAIVLGLVVALNARPGLWIALVVVAVFAVFHGHAHGAEIEQGADPLLYSLGFVVATGLLHAIGILIGAINRWKYGQRLVQGLGVIIALAGVIFLFHALS